MWQRKAFRRFWKVSGSLVIPNGACWNRTSCNGCDEGCKTLGLGVLAKIRRRYPKWRSTVHRRAWRVCRQWLATDSGPVLRRHSVASGPHLCVPNRWVWQQYRTIGAQHSVGSVTGDITPISVIRASSCLAWREAGWEYAWLWCSCTVWRHPAAVWWPWDRSLLRQRVDEAVWRMKRNKPVHANLDTLLLRRLLGLFATRAVKVTDLSFQVVVASNWPLMGSVFPSSPYKRVRTGMRVGWGWMLKDCAEMRVVLAPESSLNVMGAPFMSNQVVQGAVVDVVRVSTGGTTKEQWVVVLC